MRREDQDSGISAAHFSIAAERAEDGDKAHD
jgi:hypothetical protein